MTQKLLTKREKVILYITLGAFIFSIVFIFVITPLAKRLEILNREIELSRLKLIKYKRLLHRKSYILNEYNKLASDVNLPEQGKDWLFAALSAIEKFAKDSGLRLIDMRPQNSKSKDSYKDGFIDLKTEGAIEGYLKFIYKIENSLLFFKIKKFQLNAKPYTNTLEGIFSISQLSIAE